MDPSKTQPIKDLKPKYTQLFINNEFVNSKSGKTFATTNPATKQKIADVQVWLNGSESDDSMVQMISMVQII